jgi:hypothetical protein
MWVFFGLLPTLIVLFAVGGGIVLLVRRGADGWSIQFPGVLRAYVATAMLIGVFLTAAGLGLLLKAGMADAGERDFSYNTQPQTIYQPSPQGRPTVTQTIDPSDNAIRDDVATGISLTFAGVVLFGVHSFGAAILRRRKAQGEEVIARSYNLIGLVVSILGFLGTGAQALNDVMRRYVLGGTTVQPWEVRHPGGPLSVAIVLLPLMLWFGWRLWQELGGDESHEERSDVPTLANPHTAAI